MEFYNILLHAHKGFAYLELLLVAAFLILLLVTMFVTGFFRKDKRHLADLVAGTQVQMK